MFSPDDVDPALAAHPAHRRAGRRAPAPKLPGPAPSRPRSPETPRPSGALAEGNRAYEERFGRVFLICARASRPTEILASLRTRLDTTTRPRQAVVADELRKIALLRLEQGCWTHERHHHPRPRHRPRAPGRRRTVLRLSTGRRPGSPSSSPTSRPTTTAGPATSDPIGLEPGTYQLVFDTAAYAAATGQGCFFPEVGLTFARDRRARTTTSHFCSARSPIPPTEGADPHGHSPGSQPVRQGREPRRPHLPRHRTPPDPRPQRLHRPARPLRGRAHQRRPGRRTPHRHPEEHRLRLRQGEGRATRSRSSR